MAKIVKVGRFSSKYAYLCTNDDRYYLVPCEENVSLKHLLGREYNLTTEFASTFKSSHSFRVTPKFLILWCLFCLAVTILVPTGAKLVPILMWSLTAHEVGHIAVSITSRNHSTYCGFKLQYGFIPLVFISNKRVYEYSRGRRIAYYSAGIVMNLLLAFGAWLILYFSIGSQEVFNLVVNLNVFLALINLYPLLFTDGFNILRELTGSYQLRRLVLQYFFHPIILYRTDKIAFYYEVFVWFSIIVFASRFIWGISAVIK